MSQKPDWLRPHGTPWRRGRSRTVYDNRWITVTEHEATAPTGAAATYGLVGFKHVALAVLPIEADGRVVLVGQHRFPFGDYSWEIPEGGGPKHEPPLDGAKRELAEETGLTANCWEEILRLQLSNSVTDELAVGYLAYDLTPAVGKAHRDDTEDLALARAPFREALEVATGGGIGDALTVAMLLRAYQMAKEGLLPASLSRAMLG